ncbi:hypothetical protein PPROV_000483500 [Pycnococcus provasolii]|uniref:Protein FAR1-RELATED SEQUENCE n=1 Tax=Pycnococcus provasolii TaxID=41880 RepID=A0A830HGY3_9CHLO|nr:hypothetical protein PPROV_000483500 [Pycnococcus provasolii]
MQYALESWLHHYKCLREHYQGINVASHANISDQDKGLTPSRVEVLPNVLGFACEEHRGENVRKQPGVGSAGRDAYKKAVYACSEAHFNFAKSAMNEATKAYVGRLPDESQFLRSAFLAAHVRNYAVSSPVESWNNWLIRENVRHNQNIIAGFLNLINGLEKQIEKRSAAAAKCTDAAPPKIRLMLNSGSEAGKKVRDRVVTFQNAQRRVARVHHVGYPGQSRTVNLTEGTCSCGRHEVVEGPFCIDLAAASKSAGFDLSTHLHVMDTTKRWREQWECVRAWHTGKCVPCTADLAMMPEKPLKEPVARPRPKGRPAEPKRHMSAVEEATKQHKCAVCGQKGHKARSKNCPKFRMPPEDVDMAAGAAPAVADVEEDEDGADEFMMD